MACGTSGPDDGDLSGPTEVERTGVRESVSLVLDVGVVFWGPRTSTGVKICAVCGIDENISL